MSTHRIGTLRLIVYRAQGHEAEPLQHRLLQTARRALPTVLERVFDEAAPSQHFLLIERLHVRLGRCSRHALPALLSDGSLYSAALSAKITRTDNPAHNVRPEPAAVLRPEEKVLRDILHYLRTGSLPWGSGLSADELRNGCSLLWNNSFWRKQFLLPALRDKTAAVRLAVLRRRPVSLEQITALSPAPLRERTAVDNAGLIVAAPLFPAMFDRAGYLNGGKFISEEAEIRAVYLTQRLIDDDEPPDYALALNKLLCGRPPELPLPAAPVFLPGELAAAEAAASSLAACWPPFQGAGRDDLARLFFKRRGVLYPASLPLLRISPEGQDALLARLPWSENEVRLPWCALQAVWHA